MNILPSLLVQLENPHLNRKQRAELSCHIAQELEDVGDYKGACEALNEFWPRVGDKPRLSGLSQSTAANLLLRAGTLTGWIGNSRQLNGAQEHAKNLITESIHIFESLSFTKKILEGQTELAYCYWREGGYDEARVILKEVIDQLTTDSELKAKAILRSAIVERSGNRYHDSLNILLDNASLFEKISNQAIKGGYYNELGVIFKNLAASEKREDYLDRAFVEYAAASIHFEYAGHMPYRALVENNLGYLFFEAGRFKEAHEHLNRARRLFTSLKDRGSVAQVDDTRARAFLAEGRNTEAEVAARAAVRVLEHGGRQSLLAEALASHGMALSRLGLYDHARLTLYRAVEVAHQSGALNDAGLAGLTLLEELSEHLTVDEIQTIYKRAYDCLSSSQHEETLRRLLCVSSRVMSLGQENTPPELETKGTLRQVMRSYEGKLIKQALQRAGGTVTQAARLLGVSHQTLNYLLNHRHRNLLTERTPVIRRRRAIVKTGRG
jgi:tetratricopeptide (TPR) repeat protein